MPPLSTLRTYRVSFPPPTGIHPTLRITLPIVPSHPPASSCSLLAYISLPSSIFADKYQLSDPLFLASKGIKAVRALSGETDLEAPDYLLDKWGSTLLLELAKPGPRSRGEWSVDIPLHLRYLSPGWKSRGLDAIAVPWPIVFWACKAEEGTKFSVNPFDRTNLGFDGLFGPKTMFYHLNPRPLTPAKTLVEEITMPVLDLDQSRWIETGTVLAIIAGFAWIAWRLWSVRSTRKGPTGEDLIRMKKKM